MKLPAAGAGSVAYGCSDDLVEIDGQLKAEFSSSDPLEVRFSDGTMLRFIYGENGGTWSITVLNSGDLLVRIVKCEKKDEECTSPDVYSDVAIFSEGLTKAYHANRNVE